MVDAIIDQDLQLLEPEEVEGGWRSLCGAILLRTTQELGLGSVTKGQIENRRVARQWLFGGGLITFDEACAACGMDRRRLLGQIMDYADRAAGRRHRP